MSSKIDNYPYNLGDITATIPPPMENKSMNKRITKTMNKGLVPDWQNKLIDLIEKEVELSSGIKSKKHFSGNCKMNDIIGLVEKEINRAIGDNWVKVDKQDIKSILNFLKENKENEKIANYIKEYIYNPESKEELIKEFRDKFVKEYYITDINQEINFEEIEIFLLSKLEAQEKEVEQEWLKILNKKKEGYNFREQLVIKQAQKDERNRILKEIDNLIAEEILICHKENTPTSRLTSLAEKISKLKQ